MTKNYLRAITIICKPNHRENNVEEQYSIEEAKSIRTGLIALITILVMCFLTISHNASVKSRNTSNSYQIYAGFGRTDGLGVGDAVRMAGVTIGRVVAAELDEHFNAKLTLEVDAKYKIPEDSSASIVSFGLIGGKYIEIDVGGAEDYIPAGGTIGYTQDAMILEELLDRIIAMGKSKKSKKDITSSEEPVENIAEDSQETEIKGDEDE